MKNCLNCENEFNPKMDRAKFCSDLCRASFSQKVKQQVKSTGGIYIRIYSLSDPIDGSIFYIGRTIDSLYGRLLGHIKECDGVSKSAKRSVIERILSEGLEPEIVQIEEIHCRCPEDEYKANERELFWIDFYKEKGCKLTNVYGNKTKYQNRTLIRDYNLDGKKVQPDSGIVFDMEQLEQIKKDRGLKTPQSVVNFLFDSYFGKYDKPVKMNYETATKPLVVNKVAGKPIQVTLPTKFRPKMEGEKGFDYLEAKAEWEQKQKEDLTKLL